jgi:hypothetical protein
MGSPLEHSNCPFFTICMVSMPAISFVHSKMIETQHWVGDSFHRPVILLDEVIELFGLAQFNV